MRASNGAFAALAAFIGLASAAEPGKSGIYAGAEVGSASASTQNPYFGGGSLDGSTMGWGVFAGIRPVKNIGAEINYIEFGKLETHNISDGIGNITKNASTQNYAFGFYFVGYLPLPHGWDLFGKVGGASLRTDFHTNGSYILNCGHPCDATSIVFSQHSNDFAWGIGAQYHFDSMSVRAQYQKIEGGSGSGSIDSISDPFLTPVKSSPDLLSVGVAWHF